MRLRLLAPGLGLLLSIAVFFGAMPIGHAALDDETLRQLRDVLEEALGGRDTLAQGRALAILVEMGDKEALKLAKERASHDNWPIRRYALRILGRQNDKGFDEPMLKSLEDGAIRGEAFSILDNMPQEAMTRVYGIALRRGDPKLRQVAFERIAASGDEGHLAILANAAGDKDEELAKAAQSVFAQLSGPSSVEFLTTQARSRNEAIRKAAIEALMKSDDERTTPFVADLLKSKDERLRMQAASALAVRGKERELVLPVLLAVLESQPDVEMRVAAIEGIAALRDRNAAISLREMALNARVDERLAGAALMALGASGDLRNLESLEEALNTDYPHIRLGAVKAMGELRRMEAVPHLAGLISDGNREIRLAAARAMGLVGGAEVIRHLEVVAQKEVDPEVRQAAVRSIGQTKEESGLMILQGMLIGDNPELKAAAIDAILEIGNPNVVNTLQVAIDPRYPDVATKAIYSMCILDEKAGIEALRPNLNRVNMDLVHQLNSEPEPKALRLMSLFLHEGTSAQRALALNLLLQRGGPAAEIIRTIGTANSDRTIKRESYSSLADLSDAPSLPLFIAGLEDDDEVIRRLSAEALGKLNHQESMEPLKKLLEDRFQSVRVAAAGAIFRLGN